MNMAENPKRIKRAKRAQKSHSLRKVLFFMPGLAWARRKLHLISGSIYGTFTILKI